MRRSEQNVSSRFLLKIFAAVALALTAGCVNPRTPSSAKSSIAKKVTVPSVAGEQKRIDQSILNAKEIFLALSLYSADHESFPKRLEDLVPEYFIREDMLICPLGGEKNPLGYEYFGGAETDPGSKMLFRSKAATASGKRLIVTVDGTVTFAK